MPYFANVIVDGGKEYRQEALLSFEDRLAKLRALVLHLAPRKSPLPSAVLFPAGYFCASMASRAEQLGEYVAASVASIKPPFTVIWGVDGWTPLGKSELERGPTGYPFFVFALPRGQRNPMCFRQLAVGTTEADIADQQWNGRSSTCCDGVGLLIC